MAAKAIKLGSWDTVEHFRKAWLLKLQLIAHLPKLYTIESVRNANVRNVPKVYLCEQFCT